MYAQRVTQDIYKDLQLDYIDLYLIHWPMLFDQEPSTNGFSKEKFGVEDTWKAMHVNLCKYYKNLEF